MAFQRAIVTEPSACRSMVVALLAFGLAQCVDLSSMAFMVLEAACELDVRSGMWRGSQCLQAGCTGKPAGRERVDVVAGKIPVPDTPARCTTVSARNRHRAHSVCLSMVVALLAFGLAQCVDLSSIALMALEAACELDVRSGMWRGSQFSQAGCTGQPAGRERVDVVAVKIPVPDTPARCTTVSARNRHRAPTLACSWL